MASLGYTKLFVELKGHRQKGYEGLEDQGGKMGRCAGSSIDRLHSFLGDIQNVAYPNKYSTTLLHTLRLKSCYMGFAMAGNYSKIGIQLLLTRRGSYNVNPPG